MERAVKVEGGWHDARRVRSDHAPRPSTASLAPMAALPATMAIITLSGVIAAAQSSPALVPANVLGTAQLTAAKPEPSPPLPVSRIGSGNTSPPCPVPLPPAGVAPQGETAEAPRFKVRDEFNHCVVARLHGQYGGKTTLILPDGQLGTSSFLVPTTEPFKALSAGELKSLLRKGPFADYQLLTTDHYLIFYKSTPAFAQDSGRLLEALYRGLIETFRRKDVPVHDSEFPLVAVIFATEQDFRAHRKVDQQVRAYYEHFTNRIFFFQHSENDRFEPKLAALLKPQTVAHEGAHQILSNIGVQPRPSSWPAWLIEGLAEYCATTTFNSKRGIVWNGLGAVNSLHMATIRELADPLASELNLPPIPPKKIARKPSISQSESLMLKTSLTPTDYAEAWALTHYLAHKRSEEFFKYVKAMSQLPPLEPRTPAENLVEFRKFFVDGPVPLDTKIGDHIHYLSRNKKYDLLYYYQVVFQQSLGNGVVRRVATVRQSPQIIQQWVQEMTSPTGDIPIWEAIPWRTRARAEQAARDWIRGL